MYMYMQQSLRGHVCVLHVCHIVHLRYDDNYTHEEKPVLCHVIPVSCNWTRFAKFGRHTTLLMVAMAVPWAVTSLYDGGGCCGITRLTSGLATPPSTGGGTVADESGPARLTCSAVTRNTREVD